jgi:hypothetical protein
MVRLTSKVKGNRRLRKETFEPLQENEDGSAAEAELQRRNWINRAEHQEAEKVRGRCRRIIEAVCIPTDFGLLCPEDRKEELEAAEARAQAVAAEFNATSTVTQVIIKCRPGQIAVSNQKAARVLNAEMAGYMAEMQEGIRSRDAAKTREAANKAKKVARMFEAPKQEQVDSAAAKARAEANKIAKDGTKAAEAIDEQVLEELERQKVAFLDLSAAAGDIETPAPQASALDIGDDDDDDDDGPPPPPAPKKKTKGSRTPVGAK